MKVIFGFIIGIPIGARIVQALFDALDARSRAEDQLKEDWCTCRGDRLCEGHRA